MPNDIGSLKRRLRAGERLYGTMLTMPSPQLVQLLAAAGFDWLLIDCEHGAISVEGAQAMVAATAIAHRAGNERRDVGLLMGISALCGAGAAAAWVWG